MESKKDSVCCADVCEPNKKDLGCGCDHDHNHAQEEKSSRWEYWEIALSIFFMLLAALPVWPWVLAKTLLFGAAALLAGTRVILHGTKAMLHGRMEETLLMSIAMVAAFGINEPFEGAAVALFFRIGEAFEEYASRRSRKQIAAISQIQPDTARLLQESGEYEQLPAKDVLIDSRILVLPHERVALDGIVEEGVSTLDASVLTGESLPLEAVCGTVAASGMMNGGGSLTIRTTALLAQSSAARVIQMVEEASERKGSAHKTITRFARIYTPAVVCLAALLFVVPSFITGEWQVWLRRALSFLVASCPCALVLSVPLAYFAGIGAAAKRGILIKGGVFMQVLAGAKTVVFDKTGTLTKGEMHLEQTHTVPGFTQNEVSEMAAACESFSQHPYAKALTKAYAGEIEESLLLDYSETAGGGTQLRYQGKMLACGSARLMREQSIDCSALPEGAVYLAVDGKAAASFTFRDTLREDTKQTVRQLQKSGLEILMLTGDGEAQAADIARQAGIARYHARLLPKDKLRIAEQCKAEQKGLVYVGDGINDAPVLAFADVGVAMGLGTQAANEAADVILTASKLSRLPEARRLSRKTLRIVHANIIFSLVVKAVILLLAVLGIAGISTAVFADVGVLLLTVLNASRLLGHTKSISERER